MSVVIKQAGTMRRFPLVVIGVAAGVLGAQAEFLQQVRQAPLTPVEEASVSDRSGKLSQLPLKFTPYDAQRAQIPFRREILTDRQVYFADDPVGQVLAYCLTPLSGNPAAGKVSLELKSGGKTVDRQEVMVDHKFSALIPIEKLAVGTYEMTGEFEAGGKVWTLRPAQFSKIAERRNTQPIPEGGIPLVLQSAPEKGRQTSPIITGIPIPRHQAQSPEEFALLENGKPVDAQFTQRATWYPGQQVKWLGLSFLARYEDGRPAEYRVVRKSTSPGKSSLTVAETGKDIVVNTGAIAFEIGKAPFTGIRSVKLAGQEKPLVQGDGGPFLIDEREMIFQSALDETADVRVEEQGPVRVTVLATGWLTNPRNERLCRYEIRFTAWAGQPWIDVHQRTILTFNTDEKRLARLGFSVPVVDAQKWAAGVDGSAMAGEIPALPPVDPKKKKPVNSAPVTTKWMIQPRPDQVAVEGISGSTAPGKRADGWVTLSGPLGATQVSVRNLWQLFPKEIAWSPNALVVYQWPEHGRVSFTEEEELSADHLHQIRYAHQGKYLDLKFPQKYFDAMRRVYPPIIENQDINALSGNGMGMAITTDFRLQFAPTIPDEAAAAANRMFAANLHGISDPVWNGLSEVEGRFAGKQKGVTDSWDAFWAQAFHGFTASVDYLGDYGMWIWPDVHNNWSPTTLRPQAHRWWLNSHYQNPWDYNFMYFRSADFRNKDWADNASQHFMDVGTVNYSDEERTLLGKLPGANYHVKGFTPWGSAREGEVVGDDYVEVGAHFINPDANLFRYLLFGDRSGLNLARKWFESLERVTLPTERSREACTTLGEVLSFYENTWEPQAIAYIHELADAMVSRPFSEVPAYPAHPLFHDRWVMRYWNLTGDERIQQPVLDVLKVGNKLNYTHFELAALAWRWTGDLGYLKMFLPKAAPSFGKIYRNPDDPLDGFGERVFKPTHSQTQIVPYYLQALTDAGLKYPEVESRPASIDKDTPLPKLDKMINLGSSTSLLKVDGAGPLTLKVEATYDARTWEKRGAVGNVEVYDSRNQLAGSASLLAGARSASAVIALDPAKFPQPWTLIVRGAVRIGWSGDAKSVTLERTAGGETEQDADDAASD